MPLTWHVGSFQTTWNSTRRLQRPTRHGRKPRSHWRRRFSHPKIGRTAKIMDRSEVWWADLPAPAGRRPVLILTRSAAVAVRNQVVVAQVTTTIHSLPSEVRLSRADGMARDCVVNCDVLLTVPKDRLTGRITRLSPQRMNEVHQALKFAMQIP